MVAKPKKGDIVLVEWLDSTSPVRIWHDWEDVDTFDAMTCYSVGMLGRMGKKSLVIHSYWSRDQIGHMSAIPAACVRSIKVLRKRKKVRT